MKTKQVKVLKVGIFQSAGAELYNIYISWLQSRAEYWVLTPCVAIVCSNNTARPVYGYDLYTKVK